MLVAWTESLETGIPEIDGDHRHVIALANQIADCIERGDIGNIVRDTLDAWSFMAGHFDREEQLMLEMGYPNYETHKKEHEDIFARMTVAFLTTPDDRKTFDEVAPVVLSWVTNHLGDAERVLAAFIRTRSTAAAA
ncbi:hypothetical protein WCLP8_1780018 [uncultured Gammaproteobacteria bacterium]